MIRKLRFSSGMSSDRGSHFLEDDISNVRGLSLEERGKLVESVCRDAMAILRGRPDFEQAQDQRSAESMATWLRLVKQYRSHGRH